MRPLPSSATHVREAQTPSGMWIDVLGRVSVVAIAGVLLVLPAQARAGDRCSSRDTTRHCSRLASAARCAYCLAPAVTHALVHNCRAWSYSAAEKRKGVFTCAWEAIGNHRPNDWYQQNWRRVRRSKEHQRRVLEALWNDREVKAWLDKNIGYWRKENPWARLERGVKGAVSDVRGGSTVATNRYTIKASQLPRESCRKMRFGGRRADYFLSPRTMLDWTPTASDGDYTTQGFRPRHRAAPRMHEYKLVPGFIGANDGRLRRELRDVARKADPSSSLCLAAKRFARRDVAFGRAFADLAVTGRKSFDRFVRAAPTEAKLARHPQCRGVAQAALTQALDRAYTVAKVLRAGTSMAERERLGWIAVSGEDDQPHRPVNVPSVTLNHDGQSFPQFNLRVQVPGKPAVTTRYTIMHARPPRFVRGRPLVQAGRRSVPGDLGPALARDAEVILFIHGMDSRAEEAMPLADELHKLARRRGGKNWTVIAFDMPTQGYADNIDHRRISALSAVNRNNNRAVPLVDFMERYIVAFVETLNRTIPIKARIRVIGGGSLGGNMSMRLGRRNESWIRAVVPWSPASIWPSFANPVSGGMGHVNRPWGAVTQALSWAGSDRNQFIEKPQRRMEMFYGSFDWRPAGFIGAITAIAEHKSQADLWFGPSWPCRENVKLAARLDRHETYDANFRRWRWRLAAEQLLYSHWETTPTGKYPFPWKSSSRYPAAFLRNKKPTLLICGADDVGGDLCSHTVSVASMMSKTKGYFRRLEKTGHSIQAERPRWLASEIVKFLR